LTSLDKIYRYYISDFVRKQKMELSGKHPFIRDNIFVSQASWFGSHPEASGCRERSVAIPLYEIASPTRVVRNDNKSGWGKSTG